MHLTRVFILTSQPLFAQGVQSLLSGQPGIEVVGVATVGPDTFAQVQATGPDVVIIEAGGEEQSRLVAQVLASIPSAKVVGLTLEDNRIHTYYQQMKHGHRVEDLLEAIRGPVDWYSRSPGTLRLLVLFQGHYGQRILENIRAFAPEAWTVEAWRAPSDLPLAVDDPMTFSSISRFLPVHLPAADLVLSLGESVSAARLLPGVIECTGARAVIAPVDNVDWLPDGLARQLRGRLMEMGVAAVFPKPFCSLTERSYNAPGTGAESGMAPGTGAESGMAPGTGAESGVRQHEVSFDDPWIGEFARYFGRPAFRIDYDDQWIIEVDVERDTACGCARAVADQLVGVDVQEAVVQAGLFHRHYPCLATAHMDPDLGESLIQVSGDLTRQAVKVEIAPCLPQTVAGKLGNR
ncbi:MAG: hypothetical protein IMY75_03605 [Chloroflexi bacterium]|nr:hypothetical protein [Chloroflexota bacterium]